MRMFQTTRIKIKIVYLISLCLGVILLVGCSQLGIGQAEYSCSGMPNGVKCLSASEVYALTDTHDYTTNKITTSRDIEASQFHPLLVNSGNTTQLSKSAMAFSNSTRTEAKIMRILITPWEDGEGDLHLGEFILTEVEPAKWIIGQGY
ncbi:TraV family lipoprotein [Thorsellia anophelis]|uniref:Type IV conjugative transfer system lipoprotein (TraV) n=1 Tax=Thorsellia anophelis DSM 18579 TaxID=1123402 RepID=A0A1I0CZC2_9GAMM|nr:TraV family lipoprotein [Thorsellia anophelis]SET25218.1 Type IV conjugative transfer system lipoprotein (TraV) [Thorsellia anophelis DSM 18579]